jgi:hypothetical protein
MASDQKLLTEKERAKRALALGAVLGLWLAIVARLRAAPR